ELRWDARLQPNEIGVTVAGGVATLTGRVDSLTKKWTAEEAVQRVRGVYAVANEIEVHLPSFAERSDSDIARAAVQALEWDASVPREKIRITVAQGLLTLTGEVEWQYQRRAAEDAVWRLMGVRGVDNRITIRPAVAASGLETKIEAALLRGALHDAHRVKVEVNGSEVILRGSVRSWAEWQQAMGVAWSAPGVSVVDNRISVAP